MKRILAVLLCSAGLYGLLFSQGNIEDVLKDVEKNNMTLIALRQGADAEKIANKTGIFLQNPEIGFNYLWGNPFSIGNRNDLSITQSFDFPTVYSYQNQISDIRNEQVELEYLKQYKSVMLRTRLLLYDLVHANALEKEWEKRVTNAEGIAKASQSKFDQGEISVMEYNKAQMNLLNTRKELELVKIEKDGLLDELSGLNGGTGVTFTESSFKVQPLPGNFDEWYATAEEKNPILNWLKQEVEASEKEVKLQAAQSLPKFSTGYMSESIVGEQFRGLSVGVTIPLWENKNSVKFAKANSMAVEGVAADQKVLFYSQLKRLYSRAKALAENSEDYRINLELYDNTEYLVKALDSGEINLVEYILELGIYYESFNRVLEMERDLNRTVAELMQYE